MKKKILIITGIIFAIAIIIVISLYIANTNVRDWMDKYILGKDVIEENLPTIMLDNENINVYSYDNHIVVLSENKLVIYDSAGKEETTINVNITTPIFESNGKYLLVADKNGKNIYLIYNDTLQWQKEMEGNISKITVNKDGAVGVVITGTTHKSVIVMYGITGDEEFKIYLSTTIAMDISISEDSKYFSFAEINTSGTIINSVIKTVSVDKAKNAPTEAIIYSYEQEKNNLVVNIEYNKNTLVCQYDNSVYIFKDGSSEKIIDINNKIVFLDINLNGYISYIEEISSGILTSDYELKILNVDNKKENIYLLDSMPKSLYCSNNIIGINKGNEIEFVNHSGWLLKKFTSRQSFKGVILGDSVVGIVYKDRIEIINT